MPTGSAEYLDIRDGYYDVPGNLNRSRSQGHSDFIKRQERDDRLARDLAMKRYHDAKQSRQYATSNRLPVPSPQHSGHRRSRSEDKYEGDYVDDEWYRSQAAKLSASSLLHPDDAAFRSLPLRTRPPQRKFSVPIEVHQDATATGAAQDHVKRDSRTGEELPELYLQQLKVQRSFSDISAICSRNLHIEPASPEDLTFAKIAESIKGYDFALNVWSYEVNLEHMMRVDPSKKRAVDQAARALRRLCDRAGDLGDACAKAKPRDLKFTPVPKGDDESKVVDDYPGYANDDGDVTESLGFIIQSHLDSIALQIQTLSRLTRSIQEATPDAGAEVLAVERLRSEVDMFFGSEEALKRYSIDTKFAGAKALEEAKYNAMKV